MNSVRASFASYWQSIQHALFPQLEHVLGPLTGKQQQLVQTLEVVERVFPVCRFDLASELQSARKAIVDAAQTSDQETKKLMEDAVERLSRQTMLDRIFGRYRSTQAEE